MGRIKTFGLLLIFFGQWVFASEHRFVVFLSDKDGSAYSIDQPIDFLSERAIQRRLKQGISITEEDLPINDSYAAEIKNLGASVFFSSKWMNALLVQMDSSLVDDIAALAFVDSIEYVAKGTRLLSEQTPYDIPEVFETPTSVSTTTDLQLSMLYADSMHNEGYRGQGIYIAILDAGFPGVDKYKPFEHIHKENRLIAVRDFVRNSGNPFLYENSSNAHGTSVLSTIAMDYGEEIQGIAPEAGFILCVTEDVASEYRIEEYNWLLGAEFADSAGADIINGSLGYSTFNDASMDYDYEQLDGKTAIVSIAAMKAASKGMVVVVSAGNAGNKSWKYVTPPGDVDGILVVGSVNPDGSRTSFSSIGPTSDGRIKPDVMALGSPATIFDGPGYPDRVTFGSGTSFSSPMIAGLAAGIWQANPEWSSQEVIDAIRYSGNFSLSPNIEMGYGIPDYRLAVNKNVLSVSDIFENKISVYPNPFHEGKINIDLTGLNREKYIDLAVMDLKGTSLITHRIDLSTSDTKYQIDFPAAEKGIYLLQVSSKAFNKTIKLIKY